MHRKYSACICNSHCYYPHSTDEEKKEVNRKKKGCKLKLSCENSAHTCSKTPQTGSRCYGNLTTGKNLVSNTLAENRKDTLMAQVMYRWLLSHSDGSGQLSSPSSSALSSAESRLAKQRPHHRKVMTVTARKPAALFLECGRCPVQMFLP